MKWPPDRRPLEGSIVRLEPIAADHRDEVRGASLEAETWTWLGRDVPGSDDAFSRWLDARLAALPATFEGTFRQHMLIPGVGRRDSAYYSIVDTEWPQVRANLERRLAREPAHA